MERLPVLRSVFRGADYLTGSQGDSVSLVREKEAAVAQDLSKAHSKHWRAVVPNKGDGNELIFWKIIGSVATIGILLVVMAIWDRIEFGPTPKIDDVLKGREIAKIEPSEFQTYQESEIDLLAGHIEQARESFGEIEQDVILDGHSLKELSFDSLKEKGVVVRLEDFIPLLKEYSTLPWFLKEHVEALGKGTFRLEDLSEGERKALKEWVGDQTEEEIPAFLQSYVQGVYESFCNCLDGYLDLESYQDYKELREVPDSTLLTFRDSDETHAAKRILDRLIAREASSVLYSRLVERYHSPARALEAMSLLYMDLPQKILADNKERYVQGKLEDEEGLGPQGAFEGAFSRIKSEGVHSLMLAYQTEKGAPDDNVRKGLEKLLAMGSYQEVIQATEGVQNQAIRAGETERQLIQYGEDDFHEMDSSEIALFDSWEGAKGSLQENEGLIEAYRLLHEQMDLIDPFVRGKTEIDLHPKASATYFFDTKKGEMTLKVGTTLTSTGKEVTALGQKYTIGKRHYATIVTGLAVDLQTRGLKQTDRLLLHREILPLIERPIAKEPEAFEEWERERTSQIHRLEKAWSSVR
ncbi:MAG: hypothetical protein KDK76_06910 [Chlamydiia bacterium]|nr:hypothetical protein [Chlamydiia bacterium]